MPKPKVVVIGLDCLTPQLLFDRWLDDLPNLKACVGRGIHGPMLSVDPPITVPAWSCMMSGYNPAQLGVYGFRHRKLGTYDQRYFAYSNRVKHPRVWNHLSEAGYTVGTLAVPQTHPPRKINGWSVSGFLAGSTNERYTYPVSLAKEICHVVDDYKLDVDNFRSDDRDRILRDIYDMTEKRFALFRNFLETRPTDFMMMVEMGPDRIQHGFWRWTDPTHRDYEGNHRYNNAIFDYYKMLDAQVGLILEKLDHDTHIFIVSDHGAKSMVGGLCINEFFMRKGWLHLKEEPTKVAPLKEEQIDFTKTKCWGWGGYYGRVFINLEGREPTGVVPADAYEEFRSELQQALTDIKDPDGNALENIIFKPEEIASEPKGDYPDLLAYFDNLRWRSVGSVGYRSIYTFENDTGPDDANHADHGIFIYNGPKASRSELRAGLRLLDVGPTILQLFDIKTPQDASGKLIDL